VQGYLQLYRMDPVLGRGERACPAARPLTWN
jgi:hypothetical protein